MVSLRDAVKAAVRGHVPSKPSSTSRLKPAQIKKDPKKVKKNHVKRKYYPKTDVPMATAEHPLNFPTFRSTYKWATVFLQQAARRFGKSFVCNGLASWRWLLSTTFSGVGCAETAALSLQSAAAEFLRSHSLAALTLNVERVTLAAGCEIDKACRTVLLNTFGPATNGKHCLFADVMGVSRKRGSAFCVAHNKWCALRKPCSNNRLRVGVAGPICIPFSMMGNRLKTADPSFATHTAYYENVASDQDINIIENVPEYEEGIAKKALGPAWDIKAMKLDPRILGLGVARARIYMVAIRKSKLRWKPNFSMEAFLDAMTSQVSIVATDYWWKKLPCQKLSPSDEQNLLDYQKSRYCDKKIVDLTQLARNNRGRGETKDNALCTLTTNSGKLYSKDHGRFLSGAELLASQTLPTTSLQARSSGAPRLQLAEISERKMVRMSGNGMNVPCVGCIVLGCILGLERI